jgi:hypothetical protein
MLKLIATKPVSLFWQTIFAITIDAFAFYRIKKLRRFFLLVVIPAVLLTTIPVNVFFPTDLDCMPDWVLFMIYDTCQEFNVQVYVALVEAAFLIYSIYLVRKWSTEWNKKFELP